MMAALGADQAGSDVVVLTDRSLGKSNTAMAQGGIQCPEESRDSIEAFKGDIRRSARDKVDETFLDDFAGNVNRVIGKLAGWGIDFDADSDGQFRRGLAGGLSEPRLLSIKDKIGPSIIGCLRKEILNRQIEVRQNFKVIDFCKDGNHFKVISDGCELKCDRLIICSGGTGYSEAGKLNEVSTNPPNGNHIISNLLIEKGFERIPGNLFQYQPFGLLTESESGFGKAFPESIMGSHVEIVAADGSYIRKRDEWPDRLEICSRMKAAEGKGLAIPLDGRSGFKLSFENCDIEDIQAKFPAAMSYLKKHSIAMSHVLIRPFLHYQLGGFRTGRFGRVSVDGLFLAGEMVGGLHGRNRLMGNGLTDSLVNGYLAGVKSVEDS